MGKSSKGRKIDSSREVSSEPLNAPSPLTRESALWMAIGILKSKFWWAPDAIEAVSLIESGLEYERRVTVNLEAKTVSVDFLNANREVKSEHQIYGVCKHGGPGVGFPCEECRNAK